MSTVKEGLSESRLIMTVMNKSSLGRRVSKWRSPGGSNECGKCGDMKDSQDYCKAVSEGRNSSTEANHGSQSFTVHSGELWLL